MTKSSKNEGRNTIKVTISLPRDLYAEVKNYMDKNFFTSLSEFIRILIRDFLKKEGKHE